MYEGPKNARYDDEVFPLWKLIDKIKRELNTIATIGQD